MKHYLFKICIVFCVAILNNQVTFGQISVNTIDVFLKTLDGDKNPTITNQTELNVVLAFNISGTDAGAKFHVKMGDTDGGTNLFSAVIPFNANENQLPTGVSYRAKEDVIYLGLGPKTGLATYFVEVSVEDTAGNIGSPVKKSSN